MTIDEFKPIIKTLRIAYRRDGFLSDNDQIDLWYIRFKETKQHVLVNAVNNYIDNNTFQPTIADIKSECRKIEEHIQSIHNELRLIYNRTVGIYPNSLDDAETKTAWMDIIKAVPFDERIAKAEEVESVTIRYVRFIENSGREDIPTITEFFRGKR